MMRRLPLIESPITGWSHNAHALSVILQCDNAWPWFYSNFIQLCCTDFPHNHSPYMTLKFYEYHRHDEDWFYRTLAPSRHLKLQKIFKGTLALHDIPIIDFIVQSIDRGRYVYTSVDEKYIPQKEAYLSHSEPHDLFIFGYNRTQRHFDVAGFFDEIFTEATVSFDDFTAGYNATPDIHAEAAHASYSAVYTLEPDHSYRSSINMPLIRSTLSEYVHAQDSSLHGHPFNFNSCHPHMVFGIAVYPLLRLLTEQIGSGKMAHDIRPFHIMWEHKTIMNKRLHYLEENGITLSESLFAASRELIHDSYRIRNLMLKFRFAAHPRHIAETMRLLDSLAQNDLAFCNALLDELPV